MIHMPSKPIANAGCDTSIFFLCEKHYILNLNIHPNSSVLIHFFKMFSRKCYIMPLNPSQLTTTKTLQNPYFQKKIE